METQIIVDLSEVLSPSYAQAVWGVGYTQVELKENAPLENGNPTAYVHEYDFTLRMQNLPANIMDVCKAAFAWVSDVPGDAAYFPYNYSRVMSANNHPFEKNPWVNACVNRVVYPHLTANQGEIFIPEKAKGIDKTVKVRDNYVYLLEYFDQVVLDLLRAPDAVQNLVTLISPSTTTVDILRRAVYNVPPQALWGDCYCMAPMGASHVLLALQKAGELVKEGETDVLNRYLWAVNAQEYATMNRFSSTGMRTCYQEFTGKRLGTSVLQAGGTTSDTMAAIKLHGVAPYSRITQPLILNDVNSFVDFALNDDWGDLQHRTRLELAELYAKFSNLKTLLPALEFGRQYCDLNSLRMIAFVSESGEDPDRPALPAKINELLAENGLPGFGYFPEGYKSGDAPVPNPAAVELVKNILQRGFPICCGGAISKNWFKGSQEYGCVPPDAIDADDTYAGGHETFIVGMCERDDSDPEIKQLFSYWQDRAAQVENKKAACFADLPEERRAAYEKEDYLLFIMNSWNYWSNENLFPQGPSGLKWMPEPEAEGEKSVWLNDSENEQDFSQLGTSPVLGASPAERDDIPSHVYILPGSYLFYLSTMTVMLNPTYLSADYDKGKISSEDENAAHALLKGMGVKKIKSEDVKRIGIQIDPDNIQ